MKRFKLSGVVSGLAILAMTACSPSTPPDTASSPSPAATATTQASPDAMSASPNTATATDPKTVLTEMTEVLAQTETAVKANDFDKARTTYKDFDETYWEKIEDGVKEQSKDTYKQVEDGMDEVSNNLKAEKPDKARTIAAIESLTKTLKTYSKQVLK